MQDGEPLLPGPEVGAQFPGVDLVTFEHVIECSEEGVEGADEFSAVVGGDAVKIVDDPADGFEFPFAGETEEAVVGGDVGEEGEGAATDDSIRALTLVRAEAGEGDHVGR